MSRRNLQFQRTPPRHLLASRRCRALALERVLPMLVRCPECEHQVSDSATACPSCGHPLTPVSIDGGGTASAEPGPVYTPVAAAKPPNRLLNAGFVVGAIVLLIAFGEYLARPTPSSASAAAANSADDTSNTAMAANAAFDPATARPQHNWISHDNGEYGYTVAISDEAQKNGQAAEDVVMVRYLGFKNDLYTLVLDNGSVATCSAYCTVIAINNGYSFQHVAYNPSSVIGAAFEDAIDGQLEPWQAPPPPPETTYPSTGTQESQQPPEAQPADNGIDPGAAG
jgi:hypothetical protein